jgi:hypothetical protein
MFSGQIKVPFYGENKAKVTYEELLEMHRNNLEKDPQPSFVSTYDWDRGMQWVYARENQDNNKVVIFSFEHEKNGDWLATVLKNKGVSFSRIR